MYVGCETAASGCPSLGLPVVPGNGMLDGAALDEADDAVCEPGPSGSGLVRCGALESADGVGVGVTDGGVTSESECAGIVGVGLKTASALRLR